MSLDTLVKFLTCKDYLIQVIWLMLSCHTQDYYVIMIFYTRGLHNGSCMHVFLTLKQESQTPLGVTNLILPMFLDEYLNILSC